MLCVSYSHWVHGVRAVKWKRKAPVLRSLLCFRCTIARIAELQIAVGTQAALQKTNKLYAHHQLVGSERLQSFRLTQEAGQQVRSGTQESACMLNRNGLHVCLSSSIRIDGSVDSAPATQQHFQGLIGRIVSKYLSVFFVLFLLPSNL